MNARERFAVAWRLLRLLESDEIALAAQAAGWTGHRANPREVSAVHSGPGDYMNAAASEARWLFRDINWLWLHRPHDCTPMGIQ